jgi:hypothetical protein
MLLQSSSIAKIKTKGVKTHVVNSLNHYCMKHVNRSSEEISIKQSTFRSNRNQISTVTTTIENAISNNDNKRVFDIRYIFF